MIGSPVNPPLCLFRNSCGIGVFVHGPSAWVVICKPDREVDAVRKGNTVG